MGDKEQKIAFLISAYTEPDSLRSMIRALNRMLDADFFVHIDRKVNIEPFYTGLRDLPNVTFVEKRIRVYWGGYSQVEMQMALIEAMLQSRVRYLRVVNLTGTDYPVVSGEILRDRLSRTQVEYICGFDINSERKTGKKKMIYKYSRFYLMDTPRVIRAAVKRLRLPRLYYRQIDIPMYYGSEYWALTYDCITDLYNNYLENKPLQKLLRYAFVPSEAWIQTMFFNSEWRKNAVQQPEDNEVNLIDLSPITFFKYTDSIQILDENDYEDIVASRRIFARKIIAGKSDRLVHMLHQREPVSRDDGGTMT